MLKRVRKVSLKALSMVKLPSRKASATSRRASPLRKGRGSSSGAAVLGGRMVVVVVMEERGREEEGLAGGSPLWD